jgi:hypothetical protein
MRKAVMHSSSKTDLFLSFDPWNFVLERLNHGMDTKHDTEPERRETDCW